MDLIAEGLIPLDKSWIIRMGLLDLINGYDDCISFLEQQVDLGDDLRALCLASKQWNSGRPIEVGESGTLYRFLQYASWFSGRNDVIVRRGTLSGRDITTDQTIINYSQERLLTLDNGTSQWASAAVLMGATERLGEPPHKLQVTYDAVDHWSSQRSQGQMWEPRFDATIQKQAEAYLHLLSTGNMEFSPRQAEDYCFARAFDIITAEEAEKTWPSLRGHESDRIESMEQAMLETEVTSQDHRVVQALAMLKREDVTIQYPDAVRKSWPQFWRFMEQTYHGKNVLERR